MAWVAPLIASAEFVQPSENVWGNGNLKVIKTFNPVGFFVVVSRNPIDPMNFDLTRLTTSMARTLFIAFDKGRFTSLTMQDGSTVGLSGSFFVNLGENLRMSVSNDPLSPFITFEHRAKEGQSLLGFLGHDLVINASSQDIAEKFSAAQPLLARFGASAKPFELTPKGKLQLEDQELVAKRLGLRFSTENPCSSPEAVFVGSPDGALLRGSMVPLLTTDGVIIGMDTRSDKSFLKITRSAETGACEVASLVP